MRDLRLDVIIRVMTENRVRKPASKKRTIAQLSNRLGTVASTCILDVLVNDRAALLRNSAAFVEILEKIWIMSDVAPEDVWAELDHRLKLSEEMREIGVRVRKGRRVSSTKLP